MARKPNYDFEKRQKEMQRKAKKDAKREERERRRREGLPDVADEPGEGDDAVAEEGGATPPA